MIYLLNVFVLGKCSFVIMFSRSGVVENAGSVENAVNITHLTVVNENYFAERKNFSAISRHLCMNMAVNFKLPSFHSKRKENLTVDFLI